VPPELLDEQALEGGPAEPVLVEPELAELEAVELLPEDTGVLPEPALSDAGEVPAEQQLIDNLLQGVLKG